MDVGNIRDWLEQWFQPSEINSSIELGTKNEAGPAEGTGFSRKADKIPKRKKHRPKVVKEKKITKIQKYTTAKPAKEKETRSTGKRKYVRKKGLNATTNQPPAEDSDMQNRAEKIKARRSLKFNEDDRQKNADLASQAQVTEASFNPEDPRSSIYAVERTHAQVACHWGGTSSSISDSFNPMQANSVSNGLTFDLNCSINQIPNKCANLMDGCGQLFESAPRETMQINQLQDFYAGMPDKTGFHLNQMQNSSVDFGQYVHSSTENTSRSDQMIHGYMIPKYPAAHPQHTERVSIRQNANPKACTREAVTINQMLQDHRLPESPITPSIHSERDAMRTSLNGFCTLSTYLPSKWNTNEVSARNSGVYTLANVQRSMALDKSRCHQRMISSGISELRRVGRPNRVQQHNQPTLCNTSDTVFAASPDKQTRHTQLPSGTENPFIENYIPSGGIHQLQYLEKRMVKGPELVPETHHASAYDDTVNNYCIAIHDEQITHTGVEADGQPVSKSTRTELRLLDGENKEANPTKKPKRVRPTKEESNGKPKGRGTRK